jgi:hypothetical protein
MMTSSISKKAPENCNVAAHWWCGAHITAITVVVQYIHMSGSHDLMDMNESSSSHSDDGDVANLFSGKLKYTNLQADSRIDKKYIIVSPDLGWMGRLMAIQKEALNTQYQLAYLSTMGGAYHICNHPEQALALAIQQEVIGRRLGAANIVVRAKLYQYLNLAQLGLKKHAKTTMKLARICAGSDRTLSTFCETIENWLLCRIKGEGENDSSKADCDGVMALFSQGSSML